MTRTSRPITVTLGPQQTKLDEWLEAGRYASASEALRAGVSALEREQAALDDWMRREVERRLATPGPTEDMEEVFDRLEAKYGAMIERDEKL